MSEKRQEEAKSVDNVADNPVYEQNRNSYGAVNRNRKQYILDGEMPSDLEIKADEITKQIDEELKKAEEAQQPMYDNNYLDKIKEK